MSTITFVHRAASQHYHVVLSCGHRTTVSKQEFAQQQLYLGKPVPCPACTTPKGPAQ
jgi:hypothetical protein